MLDLYRSTPCGRLLFLLHFYYSISANGIQLYFESFVLLCYELFLEALSFSQAGIQDFLTDTQRLRRDFQKLIHVNKV